MLSYLKPYIKVFKQGLMVFCFLTLFSTGISVVSPYVNGLFIDCISYGSSIDQVIRLAIIIVILGLSAVVLSYVNQVFTAKLKTNFSYKMTVTLISYVQRTPFLFIQKLDPAYLTTRITGDIDSVLSFFLNNIVSFFLVL
jgi:ABC-type multidrug transport system fused ATPase/permease subunit